MACSECGTPISDRATTCSARCRSRRSKRLRTGHEPTRPCAWCGEPLPADSNPTRTTCSSACRQKLAHAREPVVIECAVCATKFERVNPQKITCSPRCKSRLTRWRTVGVTTPTAYDHEHFVTAQREFARGREKGRQLERTAWEATNAKPPPEPKPVLIDGKPLVI